MRKGQKHRVKSKELISQSKKLKDEPVSTFQGRKSDDNRWLREGRQLKLPEVPPEHKEFWEIYEAIRLQNPKDMKFKNREWWFKWMEGDQYWKNFYKTMFLDLGVDDYNYLEEFEDRDDFWAAYRMYLELHGEPGQNDYDDPGTRPWIWWYGATNKFWKKGKDGTIEPIPIPEDQETWLRRHKFLSEYEKNSLKKQRERR